ncbi:hypothetical protein [Streptomyces fradiae]|uniref:hypothetical protein n=1 Tax=Streptomyces fradiae TaxID=1906 RepID=UPI0035BE3678
MPLMPDSLPRPTPPVMNGLVAAGFAPLTEALSFDGPQSAAGASAVRCLLSTGPPGSRPDGGAPGRPLASERGP